MTVTYDRYIGAAPLHRLFCFLHRPLGLGVRAAKLVSGYLADPLLRAAIVDPIGTLRSDPTPYRMVVARAAS